MKRYLTFFIVVIFLSVSCEKQETNGIKTKKELLRQFCQSFKNKDIKSIIDLGYWDNVPSEIKNKLQESITDKFELYVAPVCEIREMTSKEREPIQAKNKKFSWNIEPKGFIVIKSGNPDYGSTELPFGKRNKCFYIAVRYAK